MEVATIGQSMDWLHLEGVTLIQHLQQNFKGYDEWMLFMTKLGDPHISFLVYFPLAYICSPRLGICALWSGAVSVFLNAVFKWFLFGDRPYWWVHETELYGNSTPYLQQYRLTCETGPGSPSGHCMVTAAVLYVLIAALCQNLGKNGATRRILNGVLWAQFAAFMVGVAVSRCFIATHFPHQVVAGTIAGIIVGDLVRVNLPTTVGFCSCVFVGAASILGLGFGMYSALKVLGIDPMWSIPLAEKWCAHREWIHLDTSLFSALIKDASALIGLGLGVSVHGGDQRLPFVVKLIAAILAVVVCQGSEWIPLPQDDERVYYALSAGKMVAVIYLVTLIRAIAVRLFGRARRHEKSQ